MEYTVYRLYNKNTGKSYIGRTQNLKVRLRDHCKKESCCTRLRNSIQKHGFDAFEVSELGKYYDFESAKIAEADFITKFDSLSPKGYNLIMETHQGRQPGEETRARMGKAQQRKPKNKNVFRGIRKSHGAFEVRLNHEKVTYSKRYPTDIEAAKAYDRIALHLFGEDAGINFEENRKDYLNEDLKAFFDDFIIRKATSSKYIGVSFHNLVKKWLAYCYIGKKQITIGFYETEELARDAREEYLQTGETDYVVKKQRKRANKYAGVYLNKNGNKWYAIVEKDGKRASLGAYDSEILAHEAREKYIKEK